MLRFLHTIENLNDSQLQKVVRHKIDVLERKSKKNCPYDVELGYEVGHQPLSFDLEEIDEDDSFTINCVFGQFARKDTKMIYGLAWNTENEIGFNNGYYYYMDEQDYLYDFCKYVKDKEIGDEYEFFEYVRDFLSDYFGHFKKCDRDKMHHLFIKNNGLFLDPVRKHSIKDFKGKGNAMCSEYAIMAHNILKLFDFETFLMIGNLLLEGKESVPHAYNLITFREQKTKKKRHALLDFINDVDVYDIQYNKIGKVPFMAFIDELNSDFLDRFVQGDVHLCFEEYRYLIVGDTVLRLGLEDQKRDYFMDNYIYAKPDVNYSKIYTKKNGPML
ncbi:MAG: hypothetical protein IKF71_03565 [Bacilli bacterium]|nr:hypothetical protein [Bacilli bacterium]